MAPSASSARAEHHQKANNTSQPRERTVNGSGRVFGLDGAGDYDERTYRNLSRSPSPYRRRSRSPSPYRAKRHESRSPSPYRHSRAKDRGHEHTDARPPYKRKASPPRGRSDKRHHTDRQYAKDVKPAGPMARASNENGGSFRPGVLKSKDQPSNRGRGRSHHVKFTSRPESDTKTTASDRDMRKTESSQSNDVQMYESGTTVDETDYTLEMEKPDQDEEKKREEKRRKWAAIREKNKSNENLLQQVLVSNASESATPNTESPAAVSEASVSPSASPRIGHMDSVPASPDVMVVEKQEERSKGVSSAAGSPAAADYDPTKDMLDDRDRAAQKAQQSDVSADAYSETNPKALSTLPAEKIEPVKKQKKEFDMFNFSDDDDDDGDEDASEAGATVKGTVLDEKLLDNWDDPDGYYKLISNELVNDGRYRMIKSIGRGVFANVAQAEDKDGNVVAIKMIRKNDLMRKASHKEMDFLRKVNEADPLDKQHIIRLLGSFDHKGHLCVVFEHMSKNLRDLLKEDTSGRGLSMQAIRTYSRQMFGALRHMQNCQVVHCDLKPDNILVSADRKTIKLCDFGTAVDTRDIMERTEYLVSRFYRAPEIILGMDVSYGIDMWAIGCTIYELWTGKILFTGRNNNQMIKAFIDCLGWPTEKLLKKGLLQNVMEHFAIGPPLMLISREVDQQGKEIVRTIEQQKKIDRDLRSRIQDAARGITEGAPTTTELNDFIDLLAGCLRYNPAKRFDPKEALGHKFFPQSKPLAPGVIALKPMSIKRGGPVKR